MILLKIINLKEHFFDPFLSKTGRYSRCSRYSRYSEGAQGAQTLCFCFLDGGAPGLGTCERGALTERSKTLGPGQFSLAMAHRADNVMRQVVRSRAGSAVNGQRGVGGGAVTLGEWGGDQ